MQFRKRLRKDAAIDMASLVDVVFLLLLFFVVTTTFRETPGLDIDLPETRDAAGVQLKDVVINIAPTDDGATITLGDQQVTLDDLPAKLKAELEQREEKKRSVVVQADKNVRFEFVYRVFDIARQSGATSITVPAIFKPGLQQQGN